MLVHSGPSRDTTTIIFIEVFTIGVWALPSKSEGQSSRSKA
jgi:hypothetical protein